ncbi:hypothetical protein K9M79_05925 [Candidatus Woesearchaeota archaeon]|nr:hypothetical protein [Candidatus Woesearchaeota archaeon]
MFKKILLWFIIILASVCSLVTAIEVNLIVDTNVSYVPLGPNPKVTNLTVIIPIAKDNSYQNFHDIRTNYTYDKIDGGVLFKKSLPSPWENIHGQFKLTAYSVGPNSSDKSVYKINPEIIDKSFGSFRDYLTKKKFDDLYTLTIVVIEYVDHFYTLDNIEKTLKVKSFLETLDVNSSIAHGFYHNGVDWIYGVWLEVDSHDTMLPFDLNLNEYGAISPHVKLFTGDHLETSLVAYNALEQDAKIGTPELSLFVTGAQDFSDRIKPVATVFPWHSLVGEGSDNVVTLKIKNDRKKVIPIYVIRYPIDDYDVKKKESKVLLNPDETIYLDTRFSDVKSGNISLTFNINGVNHTTLFSIINGGIVLTPQYVDTLLEKGLRSNDDVNYDDFTRVVKDLDSTGQKEAYGQYIETSRDLIIEKDIIESDYGHTAIIKIKPGKKLYNISIYENIPKCLAQRIVEMEFSIPEFDIIDEDPIIAWRIDKIDEDVEIKYDLAALNITDCEDEWMTIAFARKIGDDIDRWSNKYYLFVPVILAIFIIILISWFSRYTKN